MAVTFSHRGVCISDLAASKRFYIDALDFAEVIDYGVMGGAQMEQTTDIPDIRLHPVMLQHRDGPRLELLHFEAPPAFGSRERRSTLQYGLVHLSFYVDDIDASAERIRAAGGHVFEETRAHYPEGRTTMLYCTDPDGVRIELMHTEGVAGRFSHSGICVEDVDASLSYFQALGFEPVENYVLDGGYEWLATVNEVPGIKLRAQMVRDKDGNVIELLKVFDPPSFGPRERRKLNQYGLTHLAFWVDDVDAVADILAARGGTWAEQTRVVMPGIELYHGADPDGVRIELMRPIQG
ncbi:VOC family protein [Flavisphingomonas formosensis]|uniref:VOC family protein n=1 Tax=Flavisphingomonas formosensis TaxID=861534 RepID=UPI0012FCE600|nr:VOC family protein [Sphingomonas formosensis]